MYAIRSYYATVTGVTLRAPELLLCKRTKVPLKVADEMGLEYPFGHVVLINRLDLLGEFEFAVELVNHRLKLGIHRIKRACRNIGGIMGEEESLDLFRLSKPFLDPVDKPLDIFRMSILECLQVEFEWVRGTDI